MSILPFVHVNSHDQRSVRRFDCATSAWDTGHRGKGQQRCQPILIMVHGNTNLFPETRDGDSSPKSRSPQGKPLNAGVKMWLLFTSEVRAGLRLG